MSAPMQCVFDVWALNFRLHFICFYLHRYYKYPELIIFMLFIYDQLIIYCMLIYVVVMPKAFLGLNSNLFRSQL